MLFRQSIARVFVSSIGQKLTSIKFINVFISLKWEEHEFLETENCIDDVFSSGLFARICQ